MVQDRRAEQPLHEDAGRRGVEAEQRVVELRRGADEEDVDDVQDEEGEDRRRREIRWNAQASIPSPPR